MWLNKKVSIFAELEIHTKDIYTDTFFHETIAELFI